MELILKQYCVYFSVWNGKLKDECPQRIVFEGKPSRKPCIKLGQPCKYLQAEFVVLME